MNHRLKKLITEWSKDLEHGDGVQELFDFYTYMQKHLFFNYEPETAGAPKFSDRLYNWISNVDSDEDQKILFRLVEWIFYLGVEDQKALFVSAYDEIIVPFLAQKVDACIDSKNFYHELQTHINSTAYCSMTESMDMRSFRHLNQIQYNFECIILRNLLNDLSDEEVHDILSKKYQGANHLIILEDFSGSGTQASKTIKTICRLFPEKDIAFVPMIAAPKAVECFEELQKKIDNFYFKSPIVLSSHSLLPEIAQILEPELFSSVRDLIKRNAHKLTYEIEHNGKCYEVGPYGFRNTASLLVQHSNCPNNSLTLLYQDTKDWNPLFPRCEGKK